MLETVTHSHFARCLHQVFAVLIANETINLMLIEAKTLGTARSEGAARDPFSLIFRGPPTPVLPQAICQLEHEDLGVLEIFLVPVGPDSEGMRYEAIFT